MFFGVLLFLVEWINIFAKQWKLIGNLHAIWGLNEEWIPFECYNRRGYDHLPIVYQQRWDAVDPGEYLRKRKYNALISKLVIYASCSSYLPYLESWAWHSQWNLRIRHRELLSFLWEFWRKFAYHHEDEELSEEWIPFECYNRREYGRPPIAYQQR